MNSSIQRVRTKFIKKLNFQVDIFAHKRYLFDAAHHGQSNGGLSFVVRGQQRHQYVDFECLTSSILFSLFAKTL